MDKIKVLIADDMEGIALQTKGALLIREDVEILGIASNGEEEVKMINELIPDLVFTDNQMPKMNGIDVIELIYNSDMERKPRFVLVTGDRDMALFERANKVVLLEDPKYNYVRRDNSIVGIKSYKTYKDYLDVISSKYEYLDGKYEELDLWNAYNFVINMIWVYTIIVTFDLDDVYEEYEKHFDLFKDLIKKYDKEIIDRLDNYNKIVLYMLLLDRETSKPAVKQLYKSFKERRNEGNFELQI